MIKAYDDVVFHNKLKSFLEFVGLVNPWLKHGFISAAPRKDYAPGYDADVSAQFSISGTCWGRKEKRKKRRKTLS